MTAAPVPAVAKIAVLRVNGLGGLTFAVLPSFVADVALEEVLGSALDLLRSAPAAGAACRGAAA